MNEDIWNWMTDRDKFDAYEDVCQELRKANARLTIADLERDKALDALGKAERERDEARAELDMQRIDREDAQDDTDVAEAIDEAARNERSETLWRCLRVKIDEEKSDIGLDCYEKDTRSFSQYRRKQRHNDAERGQAGKE